MNESKRNRLFWIAGAAAALVLCFLLCRYLFFDFHGNKQWPVVLLVAGLITSGVAAIFDGKKLMICTVLGYIAGFAFGIAFGVDGVDQGGGATNNWWIIWTISFVAIIVIGAIWEIISRRRLN